MKTCTQCGKNEPEVTFRPDPKYKDGLYWCCTGCEAEYQHQYYLDHKAERQKKAKRHYRKNKKSYRARSKLWRLTHPEEARTIHRNGHLLRGYGITQEDVAALREKQGGCCAICKRPEAEVGAYGLCLDHDHQTRRIRGLLCLNCNAILGNARDSLVVLEAAIAYLGAVTEDRA